MDIKDKILNWLANGETGSSSMAMAFVAAGITIEKNVRQWWSHPSDADDFKRCLKLVREIPEIRKKFPEIAKISPYWAALIARWSDVEFCFMNELCKTKKSLTYTGYTPKTYKLMQKIYAGVK